MTCMPCSKPIWRKYSKNEVILPSGRRGSMAWHAVPRVMMYQGDARVPLKAEAILRGLRWWRTKVWNNGCFVHLGRCSIVIWRLIAPYYYWAGTSGVRPPAVLHCYLVLDTSTRFLYVPHVSDRKYKIHESERRRRSTRHVLVFVASRDPSIQTQTKKRRGRVFPRMVGKGFWHSLFEARRHEGEKANKGWAT